MNWSVALTAHNLPLVLLIYGVSEVNTRSVETRGALPIAWIDSVGFGGDLRNRKACASVIQKYAVLPRAAPNRKQNRNCVP